MIECGRLFRREAPGTSAVGITRKCRQTHGIQHGCDFDFRLIMISTMVSKYFQKYRYIDASFEHRTQLHNICSDLIPTSQVVVQSMFSLARVNASVLAVVPAANLHMKAILVLSHHATRERKHA